MENTAISTLSTRYMFKKEMLAPGGIGGKKEDYDDNCLTDHI